MPSITPYDEVRNFFHFSDNYFDDIDRAAEDVANVIGLPGNDATSILSDHLDKRFSVKNSAARLGHGLLRSFDRATKTLCVNIAVPAARRAFQIAYHLGQLMHTNAIDAAISLANFRSDEAKSIAKIGLFI
ncbi:MAG: hypothetical protein K8F25_01135 [Fimbriimonadaceae bacterium]|nr:hypothetical protein [Alphaproteobacteria bacterium]